MKLKLYVICLMFLSLDYFYSQNETKQWYFGAYSAIDFNFVPATATFSSIMYSDEGSASISDDLGNLLFYTNGEKIWNRNHVFMANGTGLFGNGSTTQSSVILKKPGSQSLYYVFTLDEQGLANGLGYSIVDMSLAASMGSVTVKNVQLYAPSTEKLCAVKHCNNRDFWIVSHEYGNNVFRAYLLSSAGVSNVPVVSAVGTSISPQPGLTPGELKISPNGKKIGMCNSANYTNAGSVELFDFDNSTGQVSNPLVLLTSSEFCYGASFSPSSGKFYCTEISLATSFTLAVHRLYQWDVCSNNVQSILNSKVIIPTNKIYPAGLQLSPDNRVLIGTINKKYLGAIDFPDLSYPACQYVDSAISIAPKGPSRCMPNYQSSFFKPKIQMGYTLNCQYGSFQAVAGGNTLVCSQSTADISSVKWNFGDPGSGASNIVFGTNLNHIFSAIGNYTVQTIYNYNCYSDTVYTTIQVPALAPVFLLNGSTAMCSGETRTLSASNSTCTYLWSNGSTSIVTNISPTIASVYSVIATDPTTGCTATRSLQVNVSKCTNTEQYSSLNDIEIYPNPCSGTLFAHCPANTVKVQIVDQVGTILIMRELNTKETELTIPISQLQNGLYFVTFETPTEGRTVKLIKIE